MSKGLGITQRKVLALLQRQTRAVDPFALAGDVYRVRRGKGGVRRLTDAQLVAVRRALRGLEKTGKVYRVTWFKRTQWANEANWTLDDHPRHAADQRGHCRNR